VTAKNIKVNDPRDAAKKQKKIKPKIGDIVEIQAPRG
jgi:hypothetical protein